MLFTTKRFFNLSWNEVKAAKIEGKRLIAMLHRFWFKDFFRSWICWKTRNTLFEDFQFAAVMIERSWVWVQPSAGIFSLFLSSKLFVLRRFPQGGRLSLNISFQPSCAPWSKTNFTNIVGAQKNCWKWNNRPRKVIVHLRSKEVVNYASPFETLQRIWVYCSRIRVCNYSKVMVFCKCHSFMTSRRTFGKWLTEMTFTVRDLN